MHMAGSPANVVGGARPGDRRRAG